MHRPVHALLQHQSCCLPSHSTCHCACLALSLCLLVVLLLTAQVQLCQCCVCLESIAQSTRSFITDPVVCPVTPRVIVLALLSCCASLGSCCSPPRSSSVSVVFVLSASPSAHAPSSQILLASSYSTCHCAYLALVVFPCGLVAHAPGPTVSVLCLS